uniref:Protein kinase domain-containing protein n=1 Tax=Trichuris muris TaxID=70415 RepID=A0A5S6QXH9_TRIMR
MEYLNKIKSTVYSVKATVDSVLPGNPVTREFEASVHVASAGPGLLWRIYSGFKRSTQQEVSIWILEKKLLDRFQKQHRDAVVETLRRGVLQLTRLKHPYVITIEHPLEESRDSLAFCTEPVFASVANLLGRIDNMPSILPTEISDFTFEEAEIQHGLYTLVQALSFLHQDVKMLHNNICPESVLVTKRDCWKLAGFEFCSTPEAGPEQSFHPFEYQEGLPSFLQPSLNYLAPEMILGGRVVTFADVYSLGVFIFALFNKGRPIMDHEGSLSKFEAAAKELKSRPISLSTNIPLSLREDFKMCFLLTPELRPEASQFATISYFSNPTVKCFIDLEQMCQMNLGEKAAFLKAMDSQLDSFSKRVCIWKILPSLIAELKIADIVPTVFTRILAIAKRLNKSEFTTCVLPTVLHLLNSSDSRVVGLLLSNMQFLLERTPAEEIKKHLLPFLLGTLDAGNCAMLELGLQSVPTIAHLIDRDTMKAKLLPTLIHLASDVTIISVKVNALLCIARMLKSLESWMITEQVVPSLSKISSHEPGVLMVILGIFQLAYTDAAIGLPKEICARYCLPFLLAACVESSLNLQQFEGFMTLIKSMLAKIESEQRRRLNDTPKPVLQPVENNSGLIQPIASETEPERRTGSRLTLDEKKKIAQEQEKAWQFRSLPPIHPIATVQPVPAANEIRQNWIASSPTLSPSAAQATSPAIRPPPILSWPGARSTQVADAQSAHHSAKPSISSLDSIDPMAVLKGATPKLGEPGDNTQGAMKRKPSVPTARTAESDLNDLLG